MNNTQLQISALPPTQTPPFDLLKLADPSMELIMSYLKSGTCYIAEKENQIIGVMVLDEMETHATEIKNIAVQESFQGQGVGRAMLEYAFTQCTKHQHKQIFIATGNSSLGQLALYQKVGFEIEGIEKDYFLKHYPTPIVENGIPCKHRIILKRTLTGQ